MRLLTCALFTLAVFSTEASQAATISVIKEDLTLYNRIFFGLSNQSFESAYRGSDRGAPSQLSLRGSLITKENPAGPFEERVFDFARLDGGLSLDGFNQRLSRDGRWQYSTESSIFGQDECCANYPELRRSITKATGWSLDLRFRVRDGDVRYDLDGGGERFIFGSEDVFQQVTNLTTGLAADGSGVMLAGNTYRVQMRYNDPIIGGGGSGYGQIFRFRDPVDVEVPAPAPLALLALGLLSLGRFRKS